MSTRTAIVSAIALVERGWSQNAAARRVDGTPCGPADVDVACWCLTSALYRRDDYHAFPEHAVEAETFVRAVIGLRSGALDAKGKPIHEGTTQWNDEPTRTVGDVLTALHTAIAWLDAARPLRGLFVPASWRQPPVMGWEGDNGFTPDGGAPLRDLDGFLLTVEATSDTPTLPVPPPEPNDDE